MRDLRVNQLDKLVLFEIAFSYILALLEEVGDLALA